MTHLVKMSATDFQKSVVAIGSVLLKSIDLIVEVVMIIGRQVGRKDMGTETGDGVYVSPL